MRTFLGCSVLWLLAGCSSSVITDAGADTVADVAGSDASRDAVDSAVVDVAPDVVDVLDATDVAPTDSGPPDAAVCSTISPGTPVAVQCDGVDAPPTPAGGTVTDGNYALVSVTIYATTAQCMMIPPGLTIAAALAFSGTAVQAAAMDPTTGTHSFNGTYTTTGTMMTVTPMCPPGAGMMNTFGYTATATSFSVIQAMPGGPTAVEVFQRR